MNSKIPPQGASTSAVKYERVFMTPEKAREFLNREDTKNRPLRQHHVAFLSEELRSGRFIENGDTIKISDSGQLLDGQHRLAAIVDTGIAAWVVVAKGLPSSVFSVIDVNRMVRSASQVFTMAGVMNASRNASVAKAAMIVLRRWDGGYGNLSGRVSTTEVLAWYSRHQALVDTFTATMHTEAARMVTSAIVGTVLAMGQRREMPTHALEFLQQVISGENLVRGSAAFALRERLITLRAGHAHAQQTYLMAITIKACVAHFKGQPVVQLRYQKDEKFPTPV